MNRFYKQSSETEPGEVLTNLRHEDLINRAVQLAHNIADYDLFRRTLQQEFGLRGGDLDALVNEAMNIIAEQVGTGTKEVGTPKNPSNNPGERPIDVKKAGEKFKQGDKVQIVPTVEPDGGKNGVVESVNSGGGVKVKLEDGNSETFGEDELIKKSQKLPQGKFYAGPNVHVGFVPIPEPAKRPPTFTKFWAKLAQPFTSYRDSKNAHESTQTAFKQMWKGDIQKSQVNKAEVGSRLSEIVESGLILLILQKKMRFI